MGRSDKERECLIYFPLDTSFFDDPKVLLTEEEFGEIAGYFTVKLLAWIYKNGYYIDYHDNLCPSYARMAGRNFTSKIVKDIIHFLCSVGMFDQKMMTEHHILTSRGIQKRYTHIQKILRRSSNIKEEHKLFFVQNGTENVQNGTENVQLTTKIAQKDKKMLQKKGQKQFNNSNNKSISNNTSTNNDYYKEEIAQNGTENVQLTTKIAQNGTENVQLTTKIAQNGTENVQLTTKIAQNGTENVQNGNAYNMDIPIEECYDMYFSNPKFQKTMLWNAEQVDDVKTRLSETQRIERLKKWAAIFNVYQIRTGKSERCMDGMDSWPKHFSNWLMNIKKEQPISINPDINFKIKKSNSNATSKGSRSTAVIAPGDKDFGQL